MRNPFIVPLTAFACLLAACSAGSEGEGDAPAQAMEASASIIGGGEIVWDAGDQVSYAADTTAPPKAANFKGSTVVWQRKSDYYEATVRYEGDFRKIPEIFAADFAKRRAQLDSNYVTYGGEKGQSDSGLIDVRLDALTPKLAVVQVENWGFVTGAAHGSGTTEVVLWDRASLTEMQPDILFIAEKSAPEADALVCKQMAKERTGAAAARPCFGYFGKMPWLAGFRGRGGKITGVILIAEKNGERATCVSVPYRLFADKVAEGWRDQFADDPTFEGKIEDYC